MKNTIKQLEQLIKSYPDKLFSISDEDFAVKSSPEKWSKQEELGHLVDSAHNNLRRFIVGQYETNPKIVYDQNFWVPAANYLAQSSFDLVTLWELLNRQVCEVLKSMPEKNYSRTVDTGKGAVELHTLEWLAEDYVKHARHHLHHILGLASVSY
jgi:hypothetical protein